MRFITFQSKEVVDILLNKGSYYADETKMREPGVDEEDVDNCMGCTPIWVFAHPLLNVEIKRPIRQTANMLNDFSNEMSMDTEDFTKLFCIELDLDRVPPMGIRHNSSSLSRVIDSIKLSNTVAIYSIEESDDLLQLSEYEVLRQDNLFKGGFHYTRQEYKNDKTPRLGLYMFLNAEEYYDVTKVSDILNGFYDKRDRAVFAEMNSKEVQKTVQPVLPEPNRFCLKLLPGRKVMRDSFYTRFMLYCQDLSISDNTFNTIMSYITIASCWNNGDHDCVDNYSRIIVERADAIKLGANKILSDFVQREVTVDDIVDIIIPTGMKKA